MAETGNDSVQAMVGVIGQIGKRSSKISEITGVIEGIAFQTDILALNAAAEVARTGEQGRCFAVVASEVCSLTQRSAAATKEIKELISSSVSEHYPLLALRGCCCQLLATRWRPATSFRWPVNRAAPRSPTVGESSAPAIRPKERLRRPRSDIHANVL
jgi:hypothetical protein